MSCLVFVRRFNSNLIDASKFANTISSCDFQSYILKRSARWKEFKQKIVRSNMTPRVERINILYNGHPKPEIELNMARGVSTPYDCCKHLTQLLTDRSVFAIVNGIPHDMHRPLDSEGTLDYVHFKDIHHDPTEANLAFWRSCQLVLAAALESSFKDTFPVRLLASPTTSLESGSFAVDIRMEVPTANLDEMLTWRPSEQDLRSLSQTCQRVSNAGQHFECFDVNKIDAESILQDKCRLQHLNIIEGKGSQLMAYRIGDYVQICNTAPMMSSTRFIGRFAVTSLRLLGHLCPAYCSHSRDSKQLVFRAQGVAMPTAFLTHFTTFNVLMLRAKQDNSELNESGLPDYVQSL